MRVPRRNRTSRESKALLGERILETTVAWGIWASGVLCCGLLGGVMVLSCSPTVVPIKEAHKACEMQVVGLSIVASPQINPTMEGEARPVLFRVYQLKSDVQLQNATFEQIWKDDKGILGDDLVSVDELYAYPNTRTDLKFERNPAANHVVGAALFRGYQGKTWFVSFELPPPPGKGDCTLQGCDDDGCKGPNLNPRFALWLDGTRTEEGSNHLDDVTDGRRMRAITLGSKSGVGEGSSAPAASK